MVRALYSPFFRLVLGCILVSLSGNMVTVEAKGAELEVPSDEYPTIASAVAASKDGDIIQIAKGTYTEQIIIDDNTPKITLQGAGNSNTILKGSSGAIITTSGGSIIPRNRLIIINDLKLFNEETTKVRGLDVFVPTRFELNRVIIYGMTDTGIHFAEGGDLTINDSIITRNAGGGVRVSSISSGTTVKVKRCQISGNSGVYGGGMYCGLLASCFIEDTTMNSNTALYDGGGLYCVDGASCTITRATINKNRVERYGGGVTCARSSMCLLDKSSVNENNAGKDGGGIVCMARANCTIRGSKVIGNNDGGQGLGVVSL
jgi:hypothetical protein